MNKETNAKASIVIFGVTGDLAKRKLFPSIFRLYQNGKLGEDFNVIGVSRRDWSDEFFRKNVKNAIDDSIIHNGDLDKFVSHFTYHQFDVSSPESYLALGEKLDKLEAVYDTDGNRLFYLAMAPEFFGQVANSIATHGLKNGKGWSHLVIEKPFGHDFPSAQKLNNEIRAAFSEDEIYRIDHYLGKEMVQNIEVIRFANGIFEHLWNNRFISNIQVTSSESLGVESRFGYYNQSGAIRDMVQNHILQMVALLAMEPPINLSTDEVRSEKIKVLRAMRNMKPDEVDEYFVRGQYGKGRVNGKEVAGYQDEDEALSDSNTETFVAGKVMIDNYRWAGVPIYIRTGKRMSAKSTKIVVEFKDIPMNLYYENKEDKHPNLLVINIQPNEGITIHLNTKKTGDSSNAGTSKLAYHNDGSNTINTPEAYEKLIFDCILSDATNFTHWDEVALSWKFVDTISDAWENSIADFPNYASGSMGPDAATKLLEKDGFHWWPID